ncbi:unnamed protein product [Didymodactylos carnosus]|uniref:Uncharacterized protein n=1 Tax=Didymodactylos carnosus TaxID=1234261 RepID=A0A8S2F9L8_9BILA|nr:unnamed protein product [Didymodactylos carnosus]CAF4200502.1 unnamed protein product [Didymodactylos carnosus]
MYDTEAESSSDDDEDEQDKRDEDDSVRFDEEEEKFVDDEQQQRSEDEDDNTATTIISKTKRSTFCGALKYIHKQTAAWFLMNNKTKLSSERLQLVQETGQESQK